MRAWCVGAVFALAHGAGVPLAGQDAPPAVMGPAIDTVAALVRPSRGADVAPERLFLRAGYFRTRGNRTEERKLDRAMLASLERSRRISGSCAYRSSFCDQPMTGHLLSAWEPVPHPDGVRVRIDDQLVRVARPTFSNRPAFARDSAQTPAADRLEGSVLASRTFHVVLVPETEGTWRVAEVRVE